MVPESFGHGLLQAPPSPALPHVLVPESAVSPKATPVPFMGEWYLESKIWVPGMFVVLGCHCPLALSVKLSNTYMCVLTHADTHTEN